MYELLRSRKALEMILSTFQQVEDQRSQLNTGIIVIVLLHIVHYKLLFFTLKAIPGKEMYGSGVGRHFFPKAHHLYNAKKKLYFIVKS